MKLLRRKAPTGRQRIRENSAAPQPFTYNASSAVRRPAIQEQNTGRQGRREAAARPPSSLGRFWLQRFGLVILLVALVFSLANIMSLSPHAKLLPLSAANGDRSFLRSQADYQAAADKLLASSIWNHNKITIDTASFTRQMQAQFPELSSVSVALPLLAHRPVVYIQPEQPALILSSSNGSFVLDTTGKALLPSVSLSGSQHLPQVVDQSGLQVQLNHQALTADDISFIQTVLLQLGARHVSVSSMVLPPASHELDVYIAGQPYFVKFNLQNDDARQQAGTCLATMATFQRQHITPAHYIDVRVDGRAYYQ